jgi:hypothetical protein
MYCTYTVAKLVGHFIECGILVRRSGLAHISDLVAQQSSSFRADEFSELIVCQD